MKLNIGSVQKRLEHYQNIDKFPSEPTDIYGDLDQKIDLPDACADEIMFNNVIEHTKKIFVISFQHQLFISNLKQSNLHAI